MTREPGFLKRPHQKYITYQTNKYWLKFMLQLGLKNIVKSTLSQTPLPWHIRNMTKAVFFGSLVSAHKVPRELVATNAITTRISALMSYEVHA